jgi:KaiC/GvpD/RAD55 family RecA-like ATPase
MNSTTIVGAVRSIHSDWAYKTLEAAYDVIIDLKLEEVGEDTRVLMRIRDVRNVGFDSRWHRLAFLRTTSELR